MRKQYLLVIAVFLCLAGCSSQIKVTEISDKLPAGSDVEGIPFRTPKRFIAVIYEKQSLGYKQVYEMPVTLPDPDHLYLLGFSSQMLSNSTIDLSLNTDNTIQTISLKSEQKATAAATATGTQIAAATTALQARQKTAADLAKADADAAKAAAEATTTAATLAIAADKAKQAADLAAIELQVVRDDPNSTTGQRLTAQYKLRSAMLDANEAARKAGRPLYFPEVIP
jgi:hypothetical protein